MLAMSGENLDCNLGNANPRQPGSSFVPPPKKKVYEKVRIINPKSSIPLGKFIHITD
jgi:hypothetical protein